MSNFVDKRLVIEVKNLGIDGEVFTPWFDNSENIRDMLLLIDTDQNVDVVIYHRDTELIEDVGESPPMAIPANAGQLIPYHNGGNHGYSFRLGVRNTSGNVAQHIKVRLQLHGMMD